MVSEKFGVPGIEPLDEHFESTEPAYLEKFLRAMDDAKMHAVNLPVGRLRASFWDPDADKRAIAIGNAKRWVDVAVAIHTPNLRAHIQGVKGVKPNAAVAGDALKTVADYGASKNVVIHLENDDPQSEDAYLILDIIAKANTPWLRTLPDFCNSMLLNKGDDYNYKAMADLFQHAYGISHVKDSEQDGKKIYHVDLARTFGIAKAAGYKGYYSMEFDMDENLDPYAPTRALVEASLKILS
jgi:sugar phosphate isomerase/epimerase